MEGIYLKARRSSQLIDFFESCQAFHIACYLGRPDGLIIIQFTVYLEFSPRSNELTNPEHLITCIGFRLISCFSCINQL
jgi:hypothetical protein